MKYIIFKNGGNQYKASEGEEVLVDNLHLKEGDKLKLEEVLLYVDGDKVEIGQPVLSNVSVEALSMGDVKGDKVRVAKYKAKSRYRKVMGFRHQYTKLKIESIKLSAAKA